MHTFDQVILLLASGPFLQSCYDSHALKHDVQLVNQLLCPFAVRDPALRCCEQIVAFACMQSSNNYILSLIMQSEHRKAVEKEVSEGRSRSQGGILRVVIEHEVQPITKQKQLQASADGSWLQSSASMCCVLHRSEMSAPQC